MGIYKDFNVAERLKDLRKAKNLKQNEFASMVGIPRPTYSNYENGNREPEVEILYNIAKTLDIHLWELLGLTLEQYDGFEIKYMAFQQYDRYDQEIEDLMRYIHEDSAWQEYQKKKQVLYEAYDKITLEETLAIQYFEVCDFSSEQLDPSILERIAKSSDFKTMLLFLYEKFK